MPPASPERVARYGIDGALKGKLILIPELRVRLGVFGSRFVPHKLLSAITYEIQKKKLK